MTTNELCRNSRCNPVTVASATITKGHPVIPTPYDVLNRGSYWVVYVRTGQTDPYSGHRILKAIHVQAR